MNKLIRSLNKHRTKIDFLMPILYLTALFFAAFYIHTILKSEDMDIKELPDKESEQSRDLKDLDVSIQVIDKDNKLVKEIKLQNVNNTDTIIEVFEEARKLGELYYERVNYSYGTELENVLDINLPVDFKWQVYIYDENVTKDIVTLELIDKNDAKDLVIRPASIY